MKKADFGVAIYLLAAVIFFIIPIPSILLDVMLAINISLAMIILFNALFANDPPRIIGIPRHRKPKTVFNASRIQQTTNRQLQPNARF